MENKINLYYILLILLFNSCHYNQTQKNRIGEGENTVSIKIDLERNDKVSVFEIISKIEVIPLETTSKSLLNDPISKIVFHNNKFYIFDKKQEVIIAFHSDGSFIECINKRGHGKGEYVCLDDFNFNRFTGNLELMSSTGQINVYSPDNYDYIESINIPGIIHYFNHLTDDIYVLFMDVRKDFKMFFYSKSNEKIIAEAYNFPTFIMEKTYLHHTYSPFYEYNDSLFFIQSYNGQIFNVDLATSAILTERYKWDFGKHNLDISKIPEGKDYPFYINYLRSINYRHPFSFLLNAENEDYFITRFKYKHRYKNLVYHKKKRIYFLFEKFTETFQLFPFFMTNDALYACIAPQYLLYAINDSVLDDENKEKLKKIKDDDNPIIIKFTFK